MRDLAPIALFVYNRFRHTQQVVQSITENKLAARSDLIVMCDGGKNPDDWERVSEVRRCVRSLSGFKSVTVIESDSNKGLARAFIDGITFMTSQYGKGIFLEDDNVVAPHFLDYVNAGLSLYENDPSVANIAGYMYPTKRRLPETFFMRGADVWGFGTWERSWRLFEGDSSKLVNGLKEKELSHRFDYDGTYGFTQILEDQLRGLNHSWSCRWHASAFLNDMYTLYPRRPLVRNIGFDGSGTHCGKNDIYDVDLYAGFINVDRIPIVECEKARGAVVAFHASVFGPKRLHVWRRIGRRLKSVTKRIVSISGV